MSSGEKLLPDRRNSMDRIAAGAAVISEAATLSPLNVACPRVQTVINKLTGAFYYLILDQLVLLFNSDFRERVSCIFEYSRDQWNSCFAVNLLPWRLYGHLIGYCSLKKFELFSMMEFLAPPVMSSETADAALATKPGKLIVTFRWTGLSTAGLK